MRSIYRFQLRKSYVHNLGRQKTGHLCVAGKQVQLHPDRLVENMLQRLDRRRLGGRRYGWCIFGVCAMLIFHEKGSFLSDDSSDESPEKNPFSASNFN